MRTEVPRFPTATIAEVAADHRGAIKIGPFGSQLRKEEMVADGRKVYGQENVIADDWSLGDRRVRESKFNALSSCRLEAGDVVLTMMGTIGRCAVFPPRAEAGIMDSHLLRIQPDLGRVDRAYLRMVLQAQQIVGRQVTRMSHGSIMSGLSSAIVRRLELPLPPLPQQRQIAEILDTVDEAIRKTEEIIAKLKQVNQGLLHALLTRGIDDNGELRDPDRHPEQFKDSSLGRIPTAWEAMTVRRLLDSGSIESIQDGNHGEAHPKRHDFVDEGVPFVMANNLRHGRIDVASCYKITKRQFGSLRVGFAASGDVLLSHKGTMGQTAIVDDNLHEVMLTPQVTYYRCNPNLLFNRYLLCWFNTPTFLRQLAALSAQSTRAFLSITGQRQLSVAFPPMEEQKRIAAALGELNSRVEHDRLQVEKLHLLKQGLMEDLLTGRVRVTKLLEDAV